MYGELLRKTHHPYQSLSYLLFALSISSLIIPDVTTDPIRSAFVIVLISGVLGTAIAQARPFERLLVQYLKKNPGTFNISWTGPRSRNRFEWSVSSWIYFKSSPYIAEEKTKFIASIYIALSIPFLAYFNPLSLTSSIRYALIVLALVILGFSIYNSKDLPLIVGHLGRYYTYAGLIDPSNLEHARRALVMKDWAELQSILGHVYKKVEKLDQEDIPGWDLVKDKIQEVVEDAKSRDLNE